MSREERRGEGGLGVGLVYVYCGCNGVGTGCPHVCMTDVSLRDVCLLNHNGREQHWGYGSYGSGTVTGSADSVD